MPFRRGQLRYFVTVAEEGQITSAAARLQIAQSALSQAITRLESDLGIALLERRPRGVTLTAAGERFLHKAQAAVAAETDAARTARSLARVAEGTIEFGFVGSPPGLDSPVALEAFAAAHPSIDIRYRELPFPLMPTTSWLSDVDVAVCHLPPADDGVWVQALRREPRIVLAPKRHPLARRDELALSDAIDQTFIGFHPSIEPTWAGFWSLDDHRGSRARMTVDRAANPQEVLAALAVRRAITTVPSSVAAMIVSLATGVAAVPLRDAEPAEIVLVGHEDRCNPLVEALRSFARGFARDGATAVTAVHGP